MPVLGRRDQHGIDIFVRQQLLVFRYALGARPEILSPPKSVFQIRFVDVANRSDVHAEFF